MLDKANIEKKNPEPLRRSEFQKLKGDAASLQSLLIEIAAKPFHLMRIEIAFKVGKWTVKIILRR